MYRWEVVHIFILGYVTYAIMMFAPRNEQHKICIGWLISYMLGQHMLSMYKDYGGWNMEVTAHTMLEVTKLWGLTWSFRDGYISKSDLTEEQ